MRRAQVGGTIGLRRRLSAVKTPGTGQVAEVEMRLILPVLSLIMLATASLGATKSAIAAPSEASKDCASQAADQHLTGHAAAAFRASCLKGPLAARRPTAPTAPGKEAHAITAPSGAARNVRSRECTAEADKRGLKNQDRKQFQLSCLATAGPVTEGETHAETPKPAKAIPGIGINNPPPPAPQNQDRPQA
jgi:hypothetical protein